VAASTIALARLRAVVSTPSGALTTLAGCVCVVGGVATLLTHPFMVDLEIPMRAAERWAHGGAPYLAAAFAPDAAPYDLPFLYPPPLLPLLAPIASLPRALVVVGWLALLLSAATWLLRRLGVRWRAVPFALAWVPFSEGLVGGNVGVILVALFVAVFTHPPAAAWRPTPRDPHEAGRPALADGLAMTLAPALKVSQPHAWVALLRRRPAAAAGGLVIVVLTAAATLPLTGLDAWRDWVAQMGRAADPAWSLRGSSLEQLFPGPLALALEAGSVVAVLFMPVRRLLGGTGLLLVLGAPSLRNYGVLFLLPALLEIRREWALVAIILTGLGLMPAVWAGTIVVAVAFIMAARQPQGPASAESPDRPEVHSPSATLGR
jgi:hypothetical protein